MFIYIKYRCTCLCFDEKQSHIIKLPITGSGYFLIILQSAAECLLSPSYNMWKGQPCVNNKAVIKIYMKHNNLCVRGKRYSNDIIIVSNDIHVIQHLLVSEKVAK